MNQRYDVIAKAYDAALSPANYDALVHHWGEYLSANEDRLSPEITDCPATTDSFHDPEIASHFGRAVVMLERLGASERPETPQDLVRGEERPALVLDLDGRVLASAPASIPLFDRITSVDELTGHLRAEDDRRLRDALARAGRIGAAAQPTVVVLEDDDASLVYFAAMPALLGDAGCVVLVLRALAPRWSEDLRAVMMQVFDLTKRECEIVEGLCDHESIADLAGRSGRSVHTVRTQVKSVFSKTGASSQTALIRLVSGLSTLSSFDRHTDEAGVEPGLSSPIAMPDGRWVEMHLHGPKDGRPVIFVHGMLDGTGIAPVVSQQLHERGIRLIAPVRASFGRSDPARDPENSPAGFAEDLRHILDELDIAEVTVMGHMAGSVYAFAAAAYLPDRVRAVINVSGGVPITTRKQFQMMTARQKIVALTARYTPKLLPMIVNGGIAQIRSGMERRFMEALYKDAAHDLEVARRPDVFAQLRAGYRFSVEQGAAAFITDAAHVTRDWSELVDPVSQPVQLIHGAHDPVVRLETVRSFAANRPNIELKELSDAGQLLFYQDPAPVLDAIDRMA